MLHKMHEYVVGLGLAAVTLVLAFALVQQGAQREDLPAVVIGDTVGVIGDRIGDIGVSPILSPILSPIYSVTPYDKQRNVTTSPSATPSVIPSNDDSMTSSTPAVSPNASSPISSPSPTPSLSQNTALSVVIINEVGWAGTGASPADEWIELYNQSGEEIDLTGWTLKSLTGSAFDPNIKIIGKIAPFGYFLLERTDDTTVADIRADLVYTGALSNGGEYIELTDNKGFLHDFVDCSAGWYAGTAVGFFSMERINPSESGHIRSNWGANTGILRNGIDAKGGSINGTPRSRNSRALF